MKVRTKCKIPKDEDEFYKRSNSDKPRSECKKCTNEDNKKHKVKYRQRPEVKARIKAYRQTEKYRSTCREAVKVYRQTLKGKYSWYKIKAKERGRTFELTFDQFGEFWQEPCSYCGKDIETIGLDRINNNRDYYYNNVCSCCDLCNKMKRSLTVEEFCAHVLLLAERINEGKF